MHKRYLVTLFLLAAMPIVTGCVGSMSDSGKAGASPMDLSLSSRETKLKEIENMILSQRDDGMDTVDLYLVDLMFTKKVLPTAPESITRDGDEAWMYSISEDVTVVVDVEHRRPVAWFHGKAIDATELATWQAKYK